MEGQTNQMPNGYPNFSQLKDYLTPERIKFIKSDPERVKFVKDFASKLAQDPQFMANVESMLKQHGAKLDDKKLAEFEINTFGWTPEHLALPSPKAAAAAVGAAVAAMVVPVPIPI